MDADADATPATPAGPTGPGGSTARLLSREHLPVVAGIVALVTLAAFENRAVMTILPTVVRDLDGWGLFGASTGASLVTFTVAMAWAGGWTDRRGPRPALLTGLAAFALAQVVSGLAPTMAVFVAGRAVSGAAEALIDTALMVLVAQALPDALRAKVFASFAAAWVLPSLLGPSVAGGIDALAGWRAVFIAPLVVVPLALLPIRSALRRTHPGAGTDGEGVTGRRRRVTASLLLAAGLAVTTFTAPLLEVPSTRRTGALAIAAGVLVVLVGAGRALPAGTARLAHGVPSIIALRLLVSAAFTGIGGVLPLMLVQTHGASTALAGVSLTVTGTLWAFGSWGTSTARAQARPAAHRLRLGGAFIAVGSLGPVLLSLDVVGLVAGMAGWALAATGMGIVSPTVSTELLAQAPASEHGRVSAAQGLAVSTGVALTTALAGAVVALRGEAMDGPAFAVLMGIGGLTALGVVGAAGRTRPLPPG
ncbi:MFS transporter [Oryzobacter terrae]|uniref:MFS transporter n=1 Tax=Oryzobacter terrae TaxID=1620385 RepID=UPI0036725765